MTTQNNWPSTPFNSGDQKDCCRTKVISVGRIHVNYRVGLFVRVPERIGSAHHPVNRRTTGTKSLASRIARLPLH